MHYTDKLETQHWKKTQMSCFEKRLKEARYVTEFLNPRRFKVISARTIGHH